jgi:TPP-dependent trihydroxycyclohexane-1,2-dione (THcHDO) dehydratase
MLWRKVDRIRENPSMNRRLTVAQVIVAFLSNQYSCRRKSSPLQESYKLTILLLDNHGFSSIGGLSRGCGNEGLGTNYLYRRGYDGDMLTVDFQANAASLGAWAVGARTFREAMCEAKKQIRTSVVAVETSYEDRIPDQVKTVRSTYEKLRRNERFLF